MDKEPYVIDKNIPTPHGWVSFKFRQTLKKMELGDSFFVPCKEDEMAMMIAKAHHKATRLFMKVVTRKVRKPLGIRVWLVEKK